MRQFAWYSPELDVIVLQTFMEDCYICFEWSPVDLYEISKIYPDIYDIEPMGRFLWYPLGEI